MLEDCDVAGLVVWGEHYGLRLDCGGDVGEVDLGLALVEGDFAGVFYHGLTVVVNCQGEVLLLEDFGG